MVSLPSIVCLCGSPAFVDVHQRALIEESLSGRIVLVSCVVRDASAEIREHLGELHLRRIDLADEVLFLNVGGYFGESVKRELAYSLSRGKKVRFWNEKEAERYLEENRREIDLLVAALGENADSAAPV